MKILYTLTAILFLASCSNNSAPAENNENPELTEVEKPAEQEKAPENTKANLLIGTWEFADPKIKVVQIMTYNEDGTYALKMGKMDIAGTWELTDDILITKSNPDAPGQKKTITQIDDKTLTVFWEPKGGKGRELVYKRK